MARRTRIQSESGVYHSISRGINKQIIFEDRGDHMAFLEILAEVKVEQAFELYAYCLMSNHYHLLLQVRDEEHLSNAMRNLNSRYVRYFNKRYGRIGALFQDRYLSEPISDDSYFLSCVRYILQNPVKAGICKYIEDYEFSSANDYRRHNDTLTNTAMVTSMVGESQVVEFLSRQPEKDHVDIDHSKRVDDNEARLIMESASGCSTSAEFQRLTISKRNTALETMLKSGVSIRQASRITGVSTGVVRRRQNRS